MSNALHNLKPAKGSVRQRKRVGRGQGSGRGGTSTRGHKGAQSRSGYSRKRAFEGGQTPLQMRVPKRGFKNINRVDFVPLNLNKLQHIATKHNLSTVDFDALRELRIVKKTDKVKVLGNGELSSALRVHLHAFSAKAKQAIEDAGGTATSIG